jgi:hypothetical protein
VYTKALHIPYTGSGSSGSGNPSGQYVFGSVSAPGIYGRTNPLKQYTYIKILNDSSILINRHLKKLSCFLSVLFFASFLRFFLILNLCLHETGAYHSIYTGGQPAPDALSAASQKESS